MALPLSAVNAMDQSTFLSHFGDVAEHSPWVAESAYSSRPFASHEKLVGAFHAAIMSADTNANLSLIRAHPDLAGKAAMAGELTEASKGEQAGAGLGRLSEEEFQRFTDYNERYKAAFGFPFILAVKGATKHDILTSFEARLQNSKDAEYQTAIAQIKKIVGFRLTDMVIKDSPDEH